MAFVAFVGFVGFVAFSSFVAFGAFLLHGLLLRLRIENKCLEKCVWPALCDIVSIRRVEEVDDGNERFWRVVDELLQYLSVSFKSLQ